MAKALLEEIITSYTEELPAFTERLDFSTFGLDWKLHDYQKKALQHALKALHLFYHDKEYLINGYKSRNYKEYPELNVRKENENFDFLANNGYPVINNEIDFLNFINRASFWMATGSGKTLVMIKLIELIHHLANQQDETGKSYIPAHDILILAPRDKILDQIKKHIDIFNKNATIKIELRSLKEWNEKDRHYRLFYDPNKVTVYYYRADNIRAENTKEYIDYRSVLNDGKWYILLDEAHKGDSETSKSHQYFTIMSRKGFLFNFSATFVDTIDIVTTAYNFNLKRFIEEGYGKHIKITNEEFRNFNKKKTDEFTDEEKYKIVLKSLIILAAIKKDAEFIKEINDDLYHNPLLIAIANTVNTEDADLKIFFKQLAKIGLNDYELEPSKTELINSLTTGRNFQFDTGKISNRFIETVRDLTKEDILRYVFNAESNAKIEYSFIEGNDKELAFRLKSAKEGSHFCLLHAADVKKWEDNILEDYERSMTPLHKSFFEKINDKDNTINILLGSQIFREGWDSDRPNVINFINLGVQKDAQKLVLQSIGRGVRIQPYKGIRKRLDKLSSTEIKKINSVLPAETRLQLLANNRHLSLETLFVFATNKDAVVKIVDELDKNKTTTEWKYIKGIKKNEIDQDLIIAEYDAVLEEDIPAYKLTNEEYNDLINYIGNEKNEKDKLFLMQFHHTTEHILDTLTKIRNKEKIDIYGSGRKIHPADLLIRLDKHYHTKQEKIKTFKKVTEEIKHYKEMKIAGATEKEIKELEELIKEKISNNEYDKKELFYKIKEGEITYEEYENAIKNLSQDEFFISKHGIKLKIDTNFLKEHYYKPILETDEQFKEYVKNIIVVPSEIRFLNNLNASKTILNKYEWWYFSKIFENVDDIYIPYFDTEKQKFRKYYPDFIFWLKKDNIYHLKFIDPKGTEVGIRNAKDKVTGFKKVFQEINLTYNNIKVKAELYFYNERNRPDIEELDEYFADNFRKIFHD